MPYPYLEHSMSKTELTISIPLPHPWASVSNAFVFLPHTSFQLVLL